MRVWLITVGEPLPLPGRDPRLLRTGLLAAALAGRGHQVTWWTSRVDHTAKSYFPGSERPLQVRENEEIRFLDGLLYRSNLSWARWINHRQIARSFRQQAIGAESPDVLLCSLPTIELSREAALYGRARGIPAVIDVRDLWPDVLLARIPRLLQPVARLAVSRMAADARMALRQATAITAISCGYLEWALRLAGRPSNDHDAAIPLGHEKRTLSPPEAEAARRRLADRGVRFEQRIIWFAGTFTRSFDLGPLLSAARTLRDRSPMAQIVLSGDGDTAAQYRSAAGGLPNVVFTGWLEAPEMAVMGEEADIAVAPYAADALMQLPNKIFDFMSSGLPIVSSLPGETAALLAEFDCGLTYRPENPASLTSALMSLLEDEAGRERMGGNGLRAFELRFQAGIVTDRLITLLEGLAITRESARR